MGMNSSDWLLCQAGPHHGQQVLNVRSMVLAQVTRCGHAGLTGYCLAF